MAEKMKVNNEKKKHRGRLGGKQSNSQCNPRTIRDERALL